MPNIKLKVYFPARKPGDPENQKTIQFDDSWTVKRAIEEIHSKANEAKANLAGGQKGMSKFSTIFPYFIISLSSSSIRFRSLSNVQYCQFE